MSFDNQTKLQKLIGYLNLRWNKQTGKSIFSHLTCQLVSILATLLKSIVLKLWRRMFIQKLFLETIII